jgi:DNA modification methylase
VQALHRTMNEIIVLGKWEKAKQAIAECKSIDELKVIRDKAEALRAYAKQAKESLEVQNNVAEIKIRCERRIGEFSRELPKENKWSSSHDGKLNILKDAGIQHYERYETIANLPEDLFQKHIEDVKKSNEELTTNGIITLARELAKEQGREEKQKRYQNQAGGFNEKDIEIWQGDFKKLSEKVENNSVDLVLTDPPYPEEFLPLWQDMFEVAERILKPGKFLVCYANHQNLDKIFQLPNNLKYYWIFKLDFTMKPIAKGRNLIATWKPVLIYQKLPFKKIETTIEDNIKFDYTERSLHDLNWGQTIQPFEYLLEKFSEPNDLIFEPFAGSGTTLLACMSKKRRCIGVEIEEKYIDIIKGRLNELRGNLKN